MAEGICAECGAATHRKYCLERCRDKARLRRRPKATCEFCAKPFPMRRGADRDNRFCSYPCAGKARYSTRNFSVVPWAQCPECRSDFIARRGRKYCSLACTQRANWKRTAQRRKVKPQPETRPCVQCGVSFTTTFQSKRFCGKSCLRTWHRRPGKDRRRARRAAAPYERIVRATVYARDGWRCGICNKPVNRNAVVPHPKAPVLDHILPIAGGGSHTYANVQCAHFLCNSIKSDKGQDQLRLIG